MKKSVALAVFAAMLVAFGPQAAAQSNELSTVSGDRIEQSGGGGSAGGSRGGPAGPRGGKPRR